MGWARVIVTDQAFNPVKDVEVEVYDVDAVGSNALATGRTDPGGMATLLGLPSTGRYFFKPRLNATTNRIEAPAYGQVRLHILASDGAVCADAVVDATGRWGTDTTIQAAITRLNTTTGNVSIFIRDGTYSEALSFTSATANFSLMACSSRLVEFPTEASATLPATPLNVIVSAGANAAITHNCARSLVVQGVMLLNSAAGTATVTCSNASGKLRFVECFINQGNNAGVCVSTTANQLFLYQCIVGAGNGTSAAAINMSTNTTMHIRDCWIVGPVIGSGASGSSLSGSSVYVSNATQAVSLGAARGRITNNYIKQAGAGAGVVCTAVANPSVGWTITGNQIDGAGSGTSSFGIDVGDHCRAVCGLNVIVGFATGVRRNGDSRVTIRGHEYQDVTNLVTGVPWFIGAKAHRAAAQNIPNNLVTKVLVDTVAFDPNGNISLVNNDYTVPATGYYQVNGQVMFDVVAVAAANDYALAAVYVNGALLAYGNITPVVAGKYFGSQVAEILQLTLGDKVDLRCFQINSGAAATPLLVVPPGSNRFSISKLQQ